MILYTPMLKYWSRHIITSNSFSRHKNLLMKSIQRRGHRMRRRRQSWSRTWDQVCPPCFHPYHPLSRLQALPITHNHTWWHDRWRVLPSSHSSEGAVLHSFADLGLGNSRLGMGSRPQPLLCPSSRSSRMPTHSARAGDSLRSRARARSRWSSACGWSGRQSAALQHIILILEY